MMWTFESVQVFCAGVASDEEYLENGFFANSSLVESAGRIVAIDTPMLASLAGPMIQGTKDRDLDAIINTHGHLDHHLTNCLFTPNHVIQSRATGAYLRRFEDYVGYYLGLKEYRPVANQLQPLRVVQADIEVETSMIVQVGEIDLDVRFVGAGESDDSMVVAAPQLSLLFAGDLVYSGVHPFIGRLDRIPRWIHALRGLKHLGCQYVIPGHGVPCETSQGVESAIAYLQRFESQFLMLTARGLGAEDIKEQIDLGPFANFAMRKSFLHFSIDCLCSGYPKSAVQ